MIQLITGLKGSGKTKRIIDAANLNAETAKGEIVFITDNDRYGYVINRKIRMLNANVLKREYSSDPIASNSLIGFIKGLLAANNDIETVYIDGAHRILEQKVADMEEFYSDLDELSQKTSANFVLTVSEDRKKLPVFLLKYKG